jgi:nucleoside-diphosphate-sugar epimerase
MRVVVTGATGNVGTSVVEALSRDPQVESIVGLARRRPALAVPKVSWVTGDVRGEDGDLERHFEGAAAVVHLAWAIQPSRDRAALRAANVAGSERVFEAAARAGVPALVYASSVGAYSPGPKDRLVDEGWPTEGISSSFYAADKAAVERILDAFETQHPELRVVRLRPGLIFKRGAATEIRRLFLGPFVPSPLLSPRMIPVVPRIPGLRFQAVHAEDVAEAYRRATVGTARGAFNIAAEPVLDPEVLAESLGARVIPMPARLLRALAATTWRLRLQPTPPGWVDMALSVPLMDTRRARIELGWEPAHSSVDALRELLQGIADHAGEATPPLDPQTSGPLRANEIRTGVGGRAY